MRVQVIATKSCSHRPVLEHELQHIGQDYQLLFVEEHPEVVERLGIRHSPNLVVDGVVVCRGPVPEGDLRRLIDHAATASE